ncbi:DUF3710 domain-containing protein [Demequina litorisediminis]|uniref:DUF3710 domain-containing protein n=1 Tax=Demequina litorisediminis TaxID=1849022 RepID=A0ABQ6I7V1_9MICO|nr:DUF3710 domain-containing protein [Demequina litorisediminis]GMA33923.1 hypothetical protein GCM10025876_01270 [Demequina litorisediminis]
MAEEFADVLAGLPVAEGPWNLADAPEDTAFIDFGVLRVGTVDQLRFRPEYDAGTKTCGAVSVRSGDVQIHQVVAAPRGESRWNVLRPQMTERLRGEGAHVTVEEGHFGPELAVLRGHERPDGTTVAIPMRVQAVDGDRWMLKVTSIGPTVHEAETRDKVNALVSRCAVDRGPAAAVAGSVMTLTPPPGAPRPGGAPTGRA